MYGELVYAFTRTRSFDAVYRNSRYLKVTPEKGLLFKKWHLLQVEVYTDADSAGNIMDKNQHQVIIPSLGVIMSHGTVKSKMWWLEVVLRQNLGHLHMGFVK